MRFFCNHPAKPKPARKQTYQQKKDLRQGPQFDEWNTENLSSIYIYNYIYIDGDAVASAQRLNQPLRCLSF